VRLLIEKGAEVSRKDIRGFTALTAAACNGWWDCMSLLLEKRIDVNTVSPKGYTALSFCVMLECDSELEGGSATACECNEAMRPLGRERRHTQGIEGCRLLIKKGQTSTTPWGQEARC